MIKKTKGIRKAVLLLAVLMVASFALAGCGGGSDDSAGGSGETLNLYTWAEMFPPEVLDAYTKETGVEVNYVNFDTDETMLAKLQTAKGGEYDLIIADDYIIETAIAEGLVAELDKSKLSNYGNINPAYQGQFYDPDDKYTVPYGSGVQTIVYNPAAVDIDIKGYGDLWDSSLKDSLGIIGNYRVIDGMALKVLNESYNTEDIDKIESAGAKLNELAPNIRLIKDDELQNDLLSGEISAGVMYTSQVTMAMLENPELKVVYPEEGIGFGIMAGFIPSKAPNSEAAYKFLDFIMQPEVGAQCFEYLGYYSTFSASDEHISDEYKSFLTLPENFSQEDMEMIQNISGDADAKHSEIWTSFKKAAGQ